MYIYERISVKKLDGLKIIDIRNVSGKKTNVHKYEKDSVLFSEEISDGDSSFFLVKKHEADSNITSEVYRHVIPPYEFYSQYIRFIENKIIILDKSDAHNLKIKILDGESFEIIKSVEYEFRGELTSIPIFIDERYILVHEDIDDLQGDQYNKYSKQGLDYVMHLVDVNDMKTYIIEDIEFVKGVNVVHGGVGNLPLMKLDNRKIIIYNQTHMDDYEYEEDVYKAVKLGRISRELIKSVEKIGYIDLKKFVEEVKDGISKLSIDTITENHVDGWVRLLDINDCKLIYREKNFQSQIEDVFEMDFSSFEKKKLFSINHEEITGRLIYDKEIYEEIEKNNRITIKGIFNCDYEVKFIARSNTHYLGCIDKRYIVSSRWFEDENDKYYEYVTIRDKKNNGVVDYAGDCKIFDNVIVIFDSTGFMND
jgi:hypothetical protein